MEKRTNLDNEVKVGGSGVERSRRGTSRDIREHFPLAKISATARTEPQFYQVDNATS